MKRRRRRRRLGKKWEIFLGRRMLFFFRNSRHRFLFLSPFSASLFKPPRLSSAHLYRVVPGSFIYLFIFVFFFVATEAHFPSVTCRDVSRRSSFFFSLFFFFFFLKARKIKSRRPTGRPNAVASFDVEWIDEMFAASDFLRRCQRCRPAIHLESVAKRVAIRQSATSSWSSFVVVVVVVVALHSNFQTSRTALLMRRKVRFPAAIGG